MERADVAKRTCDIEDCGTPHYARGWCERHYRKWQRRGDPEAGDEYVVSEFRGQGLETCTVDGCERSYHCRGLCTSHYWSRIAADRVKPDPVQLELRVCERTGCGSPFPVGAARGLTTTKRFCTRACYKAQWADDHGDFRPPDDLRSSVYERDGWVCQLCKDSVDRDAHYMDDWSATLDHIIPRSKGGSDNPENLRLAHRWCNSVRNDGSRIDDEWFADADV